MCAGGLEAPVGLVLVMVGNTGVAFSAKRPPYCKLMRP
jgi:hypothetical protein